MSTLDEKQPSRDEPPKADESPGKDDGQSPEAASADSLEALEINEKALLRKLDLRLLPGLTLLYLLSFLDRSNGMFTLHRLCLKG